jgi:hypothetical protein
VDEMNRKMAVEPAKVLRASDVMPPFDSGMKPLNDGSSITGQSLPVRVQAREGRGNGSGADDASTSAAGGVEIPRYDLAENILSEQRREAARRRRGPGRAEEEPEIPHGPARVQSHLAQPSPEELAQLQKVVAEIVARDVERLCSGSSRRLYE